MATAPRYAVREVTPSEPNGYRFEMFNQETGRGIIRSKTRERAQVDADQMNNPPPCPMCGDPTRTCGHLMSAGSMTDIASAHRSLVGAGILSGPTLQIGSEAKCEECGAYYPHHLTRGCKGEHVEPVR
jgi:hypothetical protein